MAFVYEQHESIQYDGTNGAVIASKITNGEVQSDNGTLLVVIDGGSDYYINLDDWIVLRDLNTMGTPYVKPMYIGPEAGYLSRFNSTS
jgi:hypothetical protein